MLGFLCKNMFRNNVNAVLYSSRFSHMISNNNFHKLSSSLSSTSASISSTNLQNKQDFTISYLIHSCGISENAAKFAAKKLLLKTREKPDSVIELFRNYRLNNTEIANIVTRNPSILLANIEKTIKPKFEFLYSVGASLEEIVKIYGGYPNALFRSLEKSIRPSFEILKSLLQTNYCVIQTIKTSPCFLRRNLQNTLVPNITFLKNYGVPEPLLLHFLRFHGVSLASNHVRFVEMVEEIKDMGFDPSKASFLRALYVRNLMNKAFWDKKCEVFRKRGWSHNEIICAFRKHPNIMILSKEKFEKVMDFIEIIGLNSSDLATFPELLCFSLEKRIVPRCLVIQILHSKGLLMKKYKMSSFMMISDIAFIEMFITKNMELVPDLLNIYQDTVKCLGSDFQFKKGIFA